MSKSGSNTAIVLIIGLVLGGLLLVALVACGGALFWFGKSSPSPTVLPAMQSDVPPEFREFSAGEDHNETRQYVDTPRRSEDSPPPSETPSSDSPPPQNELPPSDSAAAHAAE